MTLYGYKISFSDEFNDYCKEDILTALEEKYTDFKEIVVKNYDKMYNQFTESGKSKLNVIPRSIWFELSYPRPREDGNITMAMTMFAEGKGSKIYYISIGKFNIPQPIKLDQHNKMRKDLGLPSVTTITNSKEVQQQWVIWQYRLDGEKYNNAKKAINE